MNALNPSARRQLQQMEHVVRKVNREVINPMIPPLSQNEIMPLMSLVAKLRGIYLKELFDTAKSAASDVPSEDQLRRLKQCREAYEELLAGAKALEIVVEREYLDSSF